MPVLSFEFTNHDLLFPKTSVTETSNLPAALLDASAGAKSAKRSANFLVQKASVRRVQGS
jgi:hypothetical protein